MTKKTSTGDLARISIFYSREHKDPGESGSLNRLRHRVVERLYETRHSVVFSGGWMVGAVGVELKVTLKARKLLTSLNGKNAKNSQFGQVRYTALIAALRIHKLSGENEKSRSRISER